MKKILLLAFVFALLVPVSHAGLISCSMEELGFCDLGTNGIFRINSTAGHAGTLGGAGTGYDKVACCESTIRNGTGCLDYDNDNTNDNVVVWLSDIDNAHGESPGESGGYTQEMCFGFVECLYPTGGADCETDYTCIAAMTGTTNAEFANCSTTDSDFDVRICCKDRCIPSGYADVGCNVDSDCCDTANNYCSKIDGTGNAIDSPHCCEKGWYWDEGTGQCGQEILCYQPSWCPYYPPGTAGYGTDWDTYSYWNYSYLTNTYPACFNPSGQLEACCNVFWYGMGTYDYDDVTVYLP